MGIPDLTDRAAAPRWKGRIVEAIDFSADWMSAESLVPSGNITSDLPALNSLSAA